MNQTVKTLLLMFFLLSCNSKKHAAPVVVKSDSEVIKWDTLLSKRISPQEFGTLWKDAFGKGDRKAYNKLSSDFTLHTDESFLIYALMMANQNNDPVAYADVFNFIDVEYGLSNLEGADKKTRAIAFYYLLKSYEMGFREAKYKVEEIFTDNKKPIPKSSDYLIFK
jgi:hypothetical protein